MRILKNKRFMAIISITICLAIIYAIINLIIGLINDKTNYILELQKENNQCNMQLDSIMQDYERLQDE